MAKRGRKAIDAYEMYQKKYKAVEERQHERGYAMAEPMMSRKAFENVYKHEQILREGNGKTFHKSNFIKQVAEGQRYEVGLAEARRVYGRVKEMGILEDYKVAGYNYQTFLTEYMAKGFAYQSWFQAIREFYREGRAEGKSSIELKHDIGVEFYGSPD